MPRDFNTYFRFLTIDDPKSPQGWATSHRRYQKHLEKIGPLLPRDVRRFFSVDVFHDGRMRITRFEPGLGEMEVRVNCPNVRVRDGRKGMIFKNVPFVCQFRGVTHVEIQNSTYFWQDMQFVFSEVDAKRDSGQFQLTMWFLPDAILQISASKLRVVPADGAQLRKLRRRAGTILPWKHWHAGQL